VLESPEPAAAPLVVRPAFVEVDEAGAVFAVVVPTASTRTLGRRNAETRAGSGWPLSGLPSFCSVTGPEYKTLTLSPGWMKPPTAWLASTVIVIAWWSFGMAAEKPPTSAGFTNDSPTMN
jgi:hypothetical protein